MNASITRVGAMEEIRWKRLTFTIAGYAVPEALAGFANILTTMHRLE